jgi:hypothetical protein
MNTYYSAREKEVRKVPDKNLAVHINNNAGLGNNSQLDRTKNFSEHRFCSDAENRS